MQFSTGLQPQLSSRIALTPHLRGQIALLSLDARALELHLEELLAGREDLQLIASPSHCMERLFPHRAAPPSRAYSSGEGLADQSAAPAPGLIVYVEQQVGLLFRDQSDLQLALSIAEHLAPTGWLEVDPVGLARQTPGADVQRIERVLTRLQSMEPAGLFARDLQECLTLQALDQEMLDPVMKVMLAELHLLARGDLEKLGKLAGCEEAEIASRLRQIRSFDPKPGLRFGGEALPPPEPDVMIRRGSAGWQVTLNERLQSEIRVLRPKAEAEAAALMGVIAFRDSTLLRVGQWIAENQTDFLEGGPSALLPMTRRALAADLGLHETTIGRSLRDRLLQVPRGIFAFDQLFGVLRPRRARHAALIPDATALRSVEGSASPRAVRERLAALIKAEPKALPMSDEDLARALRDEGVPLARRTVAKYRAMLGIAPASLRAARK